MTGLTESYQKEIFDFLRTVTIKFEPFAFIMGQSHMVQYGFEDPDDTWNPYYQNLAGQYAETDERMYVYCPEEARMVPFNRDTLAAYPKTAALYRIPNQEYLTLEERYPQNVGLIRTIAYSTPDIRDIIAAPNLSLLGYDASLLHINERESLLRCLRKFLDMVKVRWWVPEFCYEDMYSTTFWWMLWQYLPVVLLTERMKNIRTPAVHPFHVWEYLKSKGLGDYRDVLSNNQSLWLYRNINYIHQNEGKNSNLRILAENLLEEISVSLLYKDMVHETDTRWKELEANPRFRSYNLITHREVLNEDFATLNDRLCDLDIEHRNDAEYVDETEEYLGVTNYNRLPTKYLELKKDPINTSNERMMVNFFLETLAYRLSENDLAYEVKVTDPWTNTTLKLFIGDMYALSSYVLWRSLGQVPTYLPKHAMIHFAFCRKYPTDSDVRKQIYWNNRSYLLKSWLDMDAMKNRITWHERRFTDVEDFMESLTTQFRALLKFKQDIDNSNSYLYHSCMAAFFADIMVHRKVDLFQDITYADWFKEHPDVAELMATLETTTNPMADFTNLAVKCFDAMFPLDQTTSEEFLGSARLLDSLYNSVRDLFIQLGGYNVTYLEIDRDTREYLRMEEPDIIPFSTLTYHFKGLWNLILEQYYYTGKWIQDPALPNISFSLIPKMTKLNSDLSFDLEVDKDRVEKMTWRDKRLLPYSQDLIPLTLHQIRKQSIEGSNITCKMRSLYVTGSDS